MFEKILTNQVKNEKDTANHEKDSKTIEKNKQTPQQLSIEQNYKQLFKKNNKHNII